jgi:hypothetical protein
VPDILIAQAFALTKNIRLGAGAFLLPYHVPVELAQRISYLDHISGAASWPASAPAACRPTMSCLASMARMASIVSE